LEVEVGITFRTVVIRLFRLHVLYSEVVCPLMKSCPMLLPSHSLQMMEPFPWPFYVGFVVDEVIVEYVSVRVFLSSPVTMVPRALHVHILSFAVHRC
jgi:hypothetical protein